MLRALAHRNFRLFFGGQGISLVGTWMTRVATSWFVFLLAEPGSAALVLGIVGFAGQLPSFLFAPLAGVLVDRWNRHRLLVVTQVLSMIQSFLLAVVAVAHQSNVVRIWELAILSVAQGLINAFDMPGRQAFLIEMVEERQDLGNAIALNSSLVNGARLIGPSIAGVLIAWGGVFWCFLIDGISYMAVIAALLAMRVAPRWSTGTPPGLPGNDGDVEAMRPAPGQPAHSRRGVLQDLKEGLRYAFGFAPIRAILLLMALVSFMGMSYTVLMPLFADRIRENDPAVMGFLMAASGVGALIGALFLAARNTVLGLGRMIVIATVIFGGGLMGFAASHVLWLSLVLMVATGFGMMIQMAASNTILQTIVEDDKRGRVMSLYTMSFIGMAPFGSLFAGGLAQLIGAPVTVVVGAAACVLAAALFARALPALRGHVRPIYRRMGIIPEVASGIQSATALRVPPEN
jgi:MFS family permease